MKLEVHHTFFVKIYPKLNKKIRLLGRYTCRIKEVLLSSKKIKNIVLYVHARVLNACENKSSESKAIRNFKFFR